MLLNIKCIPSFYAQESHLEGRDEGVRQLRDEAHSVAGQRLTAGGQVHPPQQGVQGLEKPASTSKVRMSNACKLYCRHYLELKSMLTCLC